MISTTGVSLRYGGQILFDNVNVTFSAGNCYGIIGANGAGKSTFLQVLSGDIQPNKGEVIVQPGKRLAILEQDHFQFNEHTVLKTVIGGHKRLVQIMDDKELLYAKTEFTEAEGLLLSELEGEFLELNGWGAESEAAILLNGLGLEESLHEKKMRELDGNDKVRVLLARALFGNPDILLLDEPTNHLDAASIDWLEKFLANFENTVIVVSHDRHFLNNVCTHIADVDYGKIQIYVGNYDFWYQSSQLAIQQAQDSNKKAEAKIKELQDFISRFSANASKSKQATSRKRLLEKITIEDIKPSSRKYPYVEFKPDREIGNELLNIVNLSKCLDGEQLLNNISLRVNKGDKIAFVGRNGLAKTTLFQILMEEIRADSGEFKWGVTTTQSYFPNDNSAYFDNVDLNLIDWLRQYSKDQTETYLRGWLGRMLFSGEDALKKAKVLSGGERVRCMLAKSMLSGANVLILDEPTSHLDLESITALNESLIRYKGSILFVSQDREFVQTVANRIVEITPLGLIDRTMSYDEYLQREDIAQLRNDMYGEVVTL